MKQFEIYYHHLNTEAKVDLLEEFETKPDAENWEHIPLAIVEREEPELDYRQGNGHEPVDRIAEWKRFSCHMEEYIRERTMQKYSMNNGSGVDLMMMTDAETCLWNILKYALRLHNGKAKEHDLEKVVHYACFAFSKLHNGKPGLKLVKNGK